MDVVRGLMKVMCTQLARTKHHVLLGGGGFSVDIANSPIKGSCMKFLTTLIADVEAHCAEFEWVGNVAVESWVEGSSCSCERVTTADSGQSAEHMCETLWVRCNGYVLEDRCLFEAFEELHDTPFCLRKCKQGAEVELEDGGLLGFVTCKGLKIPMDEGAKAKVPLSVQDLWVVSR